MILKHIINAHKREYFINKVNAPLAWLIIAYGTHLARKYPEPTYDNVLHPNTHILIELQDEFFKSWDCGTRKLLFEALWRVLIVKYEHSPNYRNMLDWLVMMLEKSNWKPWNPNRQMPMWRKT